MMKLVIGNKNYSSWSLRAWLCLAHYQVAFEEEQVSLNADGLKQRLSQFSPTARVPVLMDGALTVWDSLAICEYVSEQYLAGRGWPSDPGLRARARAIACEMHSGFTAVRSELPMNCRATRQVNLSDQAHQEVGRIDSMWSALCQEQGRIGPWLFGEFSIADCMYAPVVFRFKTYGIEVSSQSQAYMTTMLNHPPIQQWLAAALEETEVLPEDEAGVDV
ncbi:MAG: glutathione S-transferase family protein [Leptolyngbyaceae bacterium]|nr:glutathione S-transferase family protein [Leptolyngbyaceae bacterium]